MASNKRQSVVNKIVKKVFFGDLPNPVVPAPTPTPSNTPAPTNTPTPTPSPTPSSTPSPSTTPIPIADSVRFYPVADFFSPDVRKLVLEEQDGTSERITETVRDISQDWTDIIEWKRALQVANSFDTEGFLVQLVFSTVTTGAIYRLQLAKKDSNGNILDFVVSNDISAEELNGPGVLREVLPLISNFSNSNQLSLTLQARFASAEFARVDVSVSVGFIASYMDVFSNNFQQIFVTPTPTPTPSVTASNTPTPTPSPSPNPNPSPTPTPSSTPTIDEPPCSIFIGFNGNIFRNDGNDGTIIFDNDFPATIDFSNLFPDNGDTVIISVHSAEGVQAISGTTQLLDESVVNQGDISPQGVAYNTGFHRQLFIADFGANLNLQIPEFTINNTTANANSPATFTRVIVNIIRNGILRSINHYDNDEQGLSNGMVVPAAALPTQRSIRYYLIGFDFEQAFSENFLNAQFNGINVTDFEDPDIIFQDSFEPLVGKSYTSGSAFLTLLGFKGFFNPDDIQISFDQNPTDPVVCSVLELVFECDIDDPTSRRVTVEGNNRIGSGGDFIVRSN